MGVEVLEQIIRVAGTLNRYYEEMRSKAISYLKPAMMSRRDERSPYIRKVDEIESEIVVSIDVGYRHKELLGQRMLLFTVTAIITTMKDEKPLNKPDIKIVPKAPGLPSDVIASLMSAAQHFEHTRQYMFKLPKNFDGIFIVDGPLLPHSRLLVKGTTVIKKYREKLQKNLVGMVYESIKKKIPLVFIIKPERSEASYLLRFFKLQKLFKDENDVDMLLWVLEEGNYTSPVRLWPDSEIQLYPPVEKFMQSVEEMYVRSYGSSFPAIYHSYLKVKDIAKPMAIQFLSCEAEWDKVLNYQHDVLSKIYSSCICGSLPFELMLADSQSRVTREIFKEALKYLADFIDDPYLRVEILELLRGEYRG